MKSKSPQASPRAVSRIAGAAYLFMVLGGIIWWIAIGSKLVVAGSPAATANRVMANEQLFRLGVLYEFFMAMNLVALALTHDFMLNVAGRTLAAVGKYLVLTAAILVGAMVLLAFVALQLLRNQASLTIIRPDQMAELIGLYLNVRLAGHTISALFLDFGMIAFYSLFLKSSCIPRPLAAFGILAYSMILVCSLVNVVYPGAGASMMTLQHPLEIACIVPSILLEIGAGGWLIAKGAAVFVGDPRGFAA